MTPAVDDDFLRDFHRSLSLGPLEPGDARYVQLYEQGRDPVDRLMTTIEWAVDPSTQLLMGYRGTGKTTQVKRLVAQLEGKGYHAYHLDAEEYLNTAVPVDVIDYLLFVAGALGDCLEAQGMPAEKASFWARLQDRFKEWKVEGATLEVPGGLVSVDLKRNLKEDPSFLARLRQGTAGHLGALVTEVRAFLRAVPGAESNKVVLLVDSTDHFQGSVTTAESVQASVQALFTDHHDKLRLPVHAVYTVPPYLKARAKNITSFYSGGGLTLIPEVRVHQRGAPETSNPVGIGTLRDVVAARGEWARLLSADQLDRFVRLSGGHVRDLLHMLAELAIRSRRHPVPADRHLVDEVVAQVTNEALPLADEDARWLARIARDNTAGLATNEDIPALARFLNQGLVLCYYNGSEWYDVHPLVREHVLAQARAVEAAREEEPPPE